MTADVLVFYAGLLYGEYTHAERELAHSTWSPEIYNGAYMYVARRDMRGRFGSEPGWYRMDGIPCREDAVPRKLLVLKLILT